MSMGQHFSRHGPGSWTTPVLAGLTIGSICAAVSWLGNQPGRPSAFPDLVSMLAPAFLVWLWLRLSRSRSDSFPVARFDSGPVVVAAGAFVFALGHVWTVQQELPGFRTSVLFMLAFIAFMIMGGVGLFLASRGHSFDRSSVR